MTTFRRCSEPTTASCSISGAELPPHAKQVYIQAEDTYVGKRTAAMGLLVTTLVAVVPRRCRTRRVRLLQVQAQGTIITICWFELEYYHTESMMNKTQQNLKSRGPCTRRAEKRSRGWERLGDAGC